MILETLQTLTNRWWVQQQKRPSMNAWQCAGRFQEVCVAAWKRSVYPYPLCSYFLQGFSRLFMETSVYLGPRNGTVDALWFILLILDTYFFKPILVNTINWTLIIIWIKVSLNLTFSSCSCRMLANHTQEFLDFYSNSNSYINTEFLLYRLQSSVRGNKYGQLTLHHS